MLKLPGSVGVLPKRAIMKVSLRYEVRTFILAATLFAGVSFVTHATAQDFSWAMFLVDLHSNTARQLESFGGGGTQAEAINDAGQVVGNSSTPDGQYHAFITGSDGTGIRKIGTLG